MAAAPAICCTVNDSPRKTTPAAIEITVVKLAKSVASETVTKLFPQFCHTNAATDEITARYSVDMINTLLPAGAMIIAA